jgi:hypothetical protein
VATWRRLVQILYGRVDVLITLVDGLHVHTCLGNQVVPDDQDGDPTHCEGGPIRVVAAPLPFAPMGTSIHDDVKSGTPWKTEDQFSNTCARPPPDSGVGVGNFRSSSSPRISTWCVRADPRLTV